MRPFDLFFQLYSRLDGPTNSPTFLYRCNSTFLWCSWVFLMTDMKKNLHFCNLKKRITDRRTDGRTDPRTDRPSYRDARTNLKMGFGELSRIWDVLQFTLCLEGQNICIHSAKNFCLFCQFCSNFFFKFEIFSVFFTS